MNNKKENSTNEMTDEIMEKWKNNKWKRELSRWYNNLCFILSNNHSRYYQNYDETIEQWVKKHSSTGRIAGTSSSEYPYLPKEKGRVWQEKAFWDKF